MVIEGKSDLVEIDVVLHHETEKAFKVSTDGNDDKAAWVPKSQCQLSGDGRNRTLELPEWMAQQKGLI
jgi:hypothetical protein